MKSYSSAKRFKMSNICIYFGFLYVSKSLKSIDDNEVKNKYGNFTTIFSHDNKCDVDLNDIFPKLKVLQMILPNKITSPLKY